MNWSLYDARALERRLVSYGIPRDLARRTALLDGPATLVRIGKIQRMDLNEVPGAPLLDAHRDCPDAAAIPPEIAAWLDSDRVEVRDLPLKQETVEPDPAELAAARAAAEPATRSEAEALLAAAMLDIPPWPDFDRAAAMPVYLDNLADLPCAVLEQALADCRNICSVWPSIAEIRLAAEPYLGQIMQRYWRLAEHAGPIARPRRNRPAKDSPS